MLKACCCCNGSLPFLTETPLPASHHQSVYAGRSYQQHQATTSSPGLQSNPQSDLLGDCNGKIKRRYQKLLLYILNNNFH